MTQRSHIEISVVCRLCIFGLVTVRVTAENHLRWCLFHHCFKVSVSRQSASETGVRQ